MRVAVDTGGTFTDAVAWDGARLAAVKVPSSRADPARSVVEAVLLLERRLGRRAATVTVGTTVATNALLERRGARVGLLTTAGFEDVLVIGRQDRPSLYALDVPPPSPLVAAEDVAGVGSEVAPTMPTLLWAELGAVVVCLLRAPASPEREAQVASLARVLLDRAGNGAARVVQGSRVLPELREFERTSTAVADAYVGQAIAGFVAGIERGLAREGGAVELRVQGSAGGSVAARQVLERPVLTVLSGPAGGVLAAAQLCERRGIATAITMDVGGTSTDVALVRRGEGGVAWTTDGVVAGVPIAVPMVEVHTIGAGGGSVVRVDAAGALRVGPESAGAMPGPAAYGRGGTAPTLTDAHVVLGHVELTAEGAFGTDVVLDAGLAEAALAPLAAQLGVSVLDVARHACSAAELAMARAVRRVSVERGIDPREATLVAFGGGGGLHAAGVAEQLGVPSVVVPALAGVLSAAGILAAPPSRLLGRGVVGAGATAVAEAVSTTLAEAARFLTDETVAEADRRVEVVLEVRYPSQTAVIPLEVSGAWADPAAAAAALDALFRRFHAAHALRYGFSLDREPEVVAVRVRASGRPLELDPEVEPPTFPDVTIERARRGPIRDRRTLAGESVVGPLVVTDAYGTTFVPRGWRARSDAAGDLWLSRDVRP